MHSIQMPGNACYSSHDLNSRQSCLLFRTLFELILNMRCLFEENPPMKNCGITLEEEGEIRLEVDKVLVNKIAQSQ